ncbi:MAG: LysM peptidoglycan-binding domain-containing protein [Bacteroidales bacterium]|nr:LysM peptidoglycan-binding domain-containing protein [Bacteroidales bacterium]
MISELQEEYYRDRYLGARRILDDFEGKRSTWTSSPKVAASAEEPSGIPVDIEHPDYFDGTLVAAVDTLLLSSGDSRILLFGDGTWVYLAKDGTLIAPSSEDRLILDGNGRWRRETPKKIPPQPRPRTETASTGTAPQASSAREDMGNTSENTDAQYYTIRKGDTLASIASRYHTSVERLCQLNGITRRTTLHIGRRLRVR